ncbi:MAG: hypothetical protein GX785_03375 [Armatimonadetes bacterium]|nr:hypothetical protein [Armatimonadota bacterium]
MPRYCAVFAAGSDKDPAKQFVWFRSPDDACAQSFAGRIGALITGALVSLTKQIVNDENPAVPALPAGEGKRIKALFKNSGKVLTQIRWKWGLESKTDEDIEGALEAAITAGELMSVADTDIGAVLDISVGQR